MQQQLDRRQMRRAFEGAAESYREAAALQREVEQRLLERLEYVTLEPDRIVDLGCGLATSTAALSRRYPQAQVIGVDLARSMLARAQADGFAPLCASAEALPLPDASVDLLFSNLMLQWCNDTAMVFDEFRRVLRPQGLLLFTTFGPDTLMELRHAWSQVDNEVHVNRFTDMHLIGDALIDAGFSDPVMDMEHITVTYPEVMELMRDLKAIGAHNVDRGRRRSLTGKTRLRRMIDSYHEQFEADGRVPATYEVIYGHALGPPPGQPRRRGGYEEAVFSVDHLRGSRRR